MDFTDEQFFEDNTHKINILVSSVFLALAVIPFALSALSYYKIFHIEIGFLIRMEFLIIPFLVTNSVIVYFFGSPKFRKNHPYAYERLQHIAKYFGLFGTSVLIGILGTHAHIGIYISYAIIVFISCLYYNVRTTTLSSVFAFLVMIASQYFKSVHRIEEGLSNNTVILDWLAYSSGFAIEFIFVFLVSINMSRKSSNTLHTAIERNEKLEQTQLDFMKFVPLVLQKHEIITGYHVEHTVEYVRMICKHLKSKGLYTKELTPQNIELFAAAANLHDVGKIHIPDHILNKPGKFTPEEYAMMKRHPSVGAEIIEAMPEVFKGSFNTIAAQMALCHHERWDGTGYPNGLKGNEIPLCARIMSVADVTDALLSFRPYKQAFSIEKTMQIIAEGKGTQFEPAIADAIIELTPLVMMYANERCTIEKDIITKEIQWREQERESLLSGRTISDAQQETL